MPKAEVGSTKHLANKMKSKGLQRLRWYCQVCERQMRDENGFKMHTQSESHYRQMVIVGEDPKKFIDEFSNQFRRDFVKQLSTSHGEKSVNINHFYQEYIANKEHVHMNATRWPSLTEFAKFLGREGICRVEDTDKGLKVAWIDDSPDAMRRRDAVRRKEMQDKGDEEREQRLLREQIRRARDARHDDEDDQEQRELKRGEDGEKIKLSFGAKASAPPPPPPFGSDAQEAAPKATADHNSQAHPSAVGEPTNTTAKTPAATASDGQAATVSLKMGAAKPPQTKNVFAAAAKKNALAGSGSSKNKKSAFEQPKKMSEAERIMKEEMERKRGRGSGPGGPGSSNKRQKI